MPNLPEIQATSLSSQIYLRLRQELMSARLHPGDRLKIRDLAQQLGTSETPVREALFQLVKDGALEMKPGYYIRVRRISLQEYLELRDIRLVLEPYAALKAMPHIDEPFLKTLEDIHNKLVKAERTKDYAAALQHNFDFHFAVHRKSQMPYLIEMIERLWIQAGPLLSLLYPHGHPTYEGEHQHLKVISALRAKDEAALREAFEQDLIEGGRKFIEHLTDIESRQAAESEPAPRPRR